MTEDATAGLNATENDHYRFEVAPLKKPTDEKLVEENPEVTHQSHTSLNHTSLSRGYGTVYKAALKDMVAIKIITTEKASSLQEVKMLQTLEHVSQNLTAEYIY